MKKTGSMVVAFILLGLLHATPAGARGGHGGGFGGGGHIGGGGWGHGGGMRYGGGEHFGGGGGYYRGGGVGYYRGGGHGYYRGPRGFYRGYGYGLGFGFGGYGLGLGLGYGQGYGGYGFWPYYSYPPAYPPPSAAMAPAVPPVYVERQDVPQPQASPSSGYWYYCRAADGYYPYVKDCPDGWLQVSPSPLPGIRKNLA